MHFTFNASHEDFQALFTREVGVNVRVVRTRVNDDDNSLSQVSADQIASHSLDGNLFKTFGLLIQQNVFSRQFF